MKDQAMTDPIEHDETVEDFAPAAPTRRRPWLWVAILTAVLVAVIAGLALTARYRQSADAPTLTSAQETCVPGGAGVTLADGGKTLIIDGAGAAGQFGGLAPGEEARVSVDDEACILRELGATTAVLQHMDSTRALDGRQTDSWGGFKAAWTYHPDQGLDLLIQDS